MGTWLDPLELGEDRGSADISGGKEALYMHKQNEVRKSFQEHNKHIKGGTKYRAIQVKYVFDIILIYFHLLSWFSSLLLLWPEQSKRLKGRQLNLLQFQIQAKTDHKTTKSIWKTKKATFPDVSKKVGVSYIQKHQKVRTPIQVVVDVCQR